MSKERELQVSSAVAIQNAKATLKRDIVRGLVEVITNSDDSYDRLRKRGVWSNGKILIEVIRRHYEPVIIVTDFAEGVSAKEMDKKVGGYGCSSGSLGSFSERRFFMRGLKDAMLGFGFGCVQSIKDGLLSVCSLRIEKYRAIYKKAESKKVLKTERKQLGIEQGNGTKVVLTMKHKDIGIPRFENLKEQLEQYFSLRDIMSNPDRVVNLIEKNASGKIKSSAHLSYVAPRGDLVINNKKITIDANKLGKSEAILTVLRSSEELTGQEAGSYRGNGILIVSGRAIHDITLGSFEAHDGAQRLFGRLECPEIERLLREEEEMVISDKRDGLDWQHDFCKTLKRALDKEIKTVVEEGGSAKSIESESTRQKFKKLVSKLNSIGRRELQNISPITNRGEAEIQVPEGGFGFLFPTICMLVGEKHPLTLRAVDSVIFGGAVVEIKPDNSEIVKVERPEIQLRPCQSDGAKAKGLIAGLTHLIGKQKGRTIVRAKCQSKAAELSVEVVSKRQRKRPGMISRIRYDLESSPVVKAKYEPKAGEIIIYVRHPVVEKYLGREAKEQNERTAKVLTGELIANTFCEEIATRRVRAGLELSVGDESETIKVVRNRLTKQYGRVIHDIYVG